MARETFHAETTCERDEARRVAKGFVYGAVLSAALWAAFAVEVWLMI